MHTTWLGKFQFRYRFCYGLYLITSSAAWFGTRIILRQVSPEAPAIFDFIIALYRICDGNWDVLTEQNVSREDLDRFLAYAATFLSNVGNYFVCSHYFDPSTSLC